MKLNAEDGGNRKFILCTNNENNICRDVTYERIKRVIDAEGYNESLKYYKVEYIPTGERMYYEYTDELLNHIRELVELENGVNFTDSDKIAIALTEDEFNEECKNYAESKVEQNLIVQGIIDAEGLSLSDAETEELKNNLILDYGVASIDELIETYGEDEVNESLALLRVEKFIVDQSTVNEKTGSAEDSIENEDAYTESEDTGSDLTEYDGSEKTQDETEENMSEESIEDNTVEE